MDPRHLYLLQYALSLWYPLFYIYTHICVMIAEKESCRIIEGRSARSAKVVGQHLFNKYPLH